MCDRLIGLGNRRKTDDQDGPPRLRVAPGSGAPPEQEGPGQRPTIRRVDLVDYVGHALAQCHILFERCGASYYSLW